MSPGYLICIFFLADMPAAARPYLLILISFPAMLIKTIDGNIRRRVILPKREASSGFFLCNS